MKSSTNLVWLDLEMTGLQIEKDRIIEIATIVTDNQLNILAEGPVFAIKQPNELLAGMDDWNTKQHSKSGLLNRVKNSTVTEEEAEAKTLEFLSGYVPAGKSPMCGNSICVDRRYLYAYMPKLQNFFHYRNLDVSTLKILAGHWAPRILTEFEKASDHLALQDVRDSIAELQFYRDKFIRSS